MKERILAIDPGAERMGWAIMDRIDGNNPTVFESGFLGIERRTKRRGFKTDEPFQEYKLRVINYFVHKSTWIFHKFPLTKMVNEILPATGGGNFIAATQSELAKTALTVLHARATERLVTIVQIGATSIKTVIGGKKDASKARVRNGVIERLDDDVLIQTLKTETTGGSPIWDRSDAIATGFTYFEQKVTDR